MKSFEKRLPRAACATMVGLTILGTVCCADSFAVAGTTTVTLAGGGNGAIIGGVSSTIAMQEFSDTATVSATAAALPAAQTFGAINGAKTVSGKGGLNLIKIASLSNPTLTVSSAAGDIFVIKVAGSFSPHRAITLPGVTTSQILWNFTHAGTGFSTAGGNVLNGIFLATNPGLTTNPGQRSQLPSLNLTGAPSNTSGHIELVSNSRMTFDPFIVPPYAGVIPEPRRLFLFGAGLVAGAGVLRRKARVRVRHSAGEVLGVEPMQVQEFTPSAADRSESRKPPASFQNGSGEAQMPRGANAA